MFCAFHGKCSLQLAIVVVCTTPDHNEKAPNLPEKQLLPQPNRSCKLKHFALLAFAFLNYHFAYTPRITFASACVFKNNLRAHINTRLDVTDTRIHTFRIVPKVGTAISNLSTVPALKCTPGAASSSFSVFPLVPTIVTNLSLLLAGLELFEVCTRNRIVLVPETDFFLRLEVAPALLGLVLVR
jgi:hypothetical protein